MFTQGKHGSDMNEVMSNEAILAEHCLQQFKTVTGLEGRISSLPKGGDACLDLQFPHTSLTYHVEIKPRIDRISVLERLKATASADRNSVLLTRYLSPEMASHCRHLDLQFIDSAGNAYLNNQDGVFLFILGQKSAVPLPTQPEPTFATPAGLRVIFAFLASPSLLNAPYREIAFASNVSLGSIGPVLSQLNSRGFLGRDGSGKRGLLHRRQLAMEWATGYLGQLRPKLRKHRFAVGNPDALSDLPQGPGLTWSGEPAALEMTKYLRPEIFTLYADMRAPMVAALAAKLRMRPDPTGKLEIIERFWNPDALTIEPLAPPELVYADLLAIPDSRNHKTADLILNELIGHAQNT